MQKFIDHVQQNGMPGNYLVQYCVSDDHGVDFTLGIAASLSYDLQFVQTAMSTWSKGGCVAIYGSKFMELSSWENATLWVPTAVSNTSISEYRNSTSTANSPYQHSLQARDGDCTTIQVASGDSCGTLAVKYGISGFDLETYNNAIHPSLFATLFPGERICCTAGSLPDLSPKQNADGSCDSYLVVANDNCFTLAATHSLTIDEIELYNTMTWGWRGCNNLQTGVNMCLSKGNPPMPAPVLTAQCGPQKVGTVPPSGNQTLAELNPCPLNACCE
jgi:hypothetical protein